MTMVQNLGREDAHNDQDTAVVQYPECPPQPEQPRYGTSIPIQAGPVTGMPLCPVSPTGFVCSPSNNGSRSLCPRRFSADMVAGPSSSPPTTNMSTGTIPLPVMHGRQHSTSSFATRQSSVQSDFTDGESCGNSIRREISAMTEDAVMVVQFKWGRLGDYKCNLPLSVGTAVIVEADRGTDLGIVQSINTQGKPEEVVWRISRAATRKEQEKWQRQLVSRETAARKKAQTIVEEAGLGIQIQHAEYQFDKKKLTFHYTAPEARPNFRTVLDELFAVFRCRVWFARYSGEALERDRTNKQLISRRKQMRQAAAAEESSENSSNGPSTSPLEEDTD